MRKLLNGFKTAALICAVVSLAGACKDTPPAPDPTLSTDAPAEIVFNPDGTGGMQVITVTTNLPEWDFTLTPDNAWLTATDSGNELSLVAVPNTSTDTRPDITLTITAGDADPVVITVKQLSADVSFFIEGLAGEVEVAYTDGTTQTATLADGELVLLAASPKIVYSISTETTGEVLIGRELGGVVDLKFEDGKLVFRPAVDGKTPVGTFAELALVRDALDGDYIQEADIDLLGAESPTDLERRNWVPIGSYDFGTGTDVPFTGNYDGAGFELRNLYIALPEVSMSSAGLFASANGGAVLSDIHVVSGSITGAYYVAGVIVGFSSGDATITDCSNGASVAGDATVTNGAVGGVVGYANAVTVIAENCHNTGLVTGPGVVGGVLGVSRGVVRSCYNEAEITGFGEGTLNYTGGVAGQTGRAGAAIDRSYNTGVITGTGRTGGVCGYNNGAIITSCYNTGAISASGSALRTGGVTGENAGILAAEGVLQACYNTGDVTSISTGTSYAGGVLGYNGSGKTVTACYGTGNVSSSGDTQNVVGGVCGWNFNLGKINTSYWLKRGDESGIGTLATGTGVNDVAAFGADSWPTSTGTGWTTDATDWKSLGAWVAGGSPDGVNSDFPTLYWE